MMRAQGWERALADYLLARRDSPFAWGSHDCCRFACDGIAAQGAPDPMQGVRAYKTAKGAARAIQRLGGNLDEAATTLAAKAGLYEIATPFAGRGCPVLADVETPWGTVEPALGLVGIDGTHAEFAGANGTVQRRLNECRRAWGF